MDASRSIPRWFAALLLLGGHAAQAPSFTVTLRLGREVIGPTAALDLVLPTAGLREPETRASRAAERGAATTAQTRGSGIWVTLPASPAAERLAALARPATGQPVTGTCEIIVAARDGTPLRRYVISGCFAAEVVANGATRRITLGYSAIRVLQSHI